MEESSEAHMETDVSSTTDDVPEAPQLASSHSDMETIILVEEVKEETDSPADPGSKRSTPSTSTNTSPQKPATPQKVSKPLISSTDVAKKITSASESHKTVGTSSVSSKTSPEKQQPESSISPKKLETTVTSGKTPDKTEKSPVKVTPMKNIQSSPFKDIKVSKGPIKLIRIRDMPNRNVVNTQDKSPTKDSPNKLDKEVTLIKISNKEVMLPETTVKLIVSPEKAKKQGTSSETSPKKDENFKEQSEKVSKSCTEKVADKSPAKEKQQSVTIMETDTDTVKNDTNSNKTASNNDTIKITNALVTSNEVSMLDTNSDKTQSSDTIVPEAAPKTMNKEDKTENTEPVEESTDQNNSQISMEVDKDHNKSISRELKSLINSAKESKIISECTQLTSKTRKSRSQLDTSNTSLNTSSEADNVRTRRLSNASQVSNSSEKSEISLKRSKRSQNTNFPSKNKMFMNAATSKGTRDSEEPMSEDETMKSTEKRSTDHSKSTPPCAKKKKVFDQPATSIQVSNDNKNQLRSDSYCWRCHWTVEQDENDKSQPPVHCTVCPRSFHYKCLSGNERKSVSELNWVCPDCLAVLQAEGSDTRSAVMKKTSLGTLCDLLKYALERMMDLNGVEPFLKPVDRSLFPDYDKYVVHPMDLSQMKENIADGLYGSTEAFVADTQWILHNSIIFNTCEQAFMQSKLTSGARAIVRSCRAEMGEIEACPECYAAAHARRPTWFTDVCTTPHILLWAKLKGFPYWPAKAMSVNSSGLVDVRFFGAHDRAWVPAKDCFLFSERDPNNFRSKRQDILDSMQEAEQHIRNLSRKYGKFVYPPFKTLFDPTNLTEQLKLMIPSFEGEVRPPLKDSKHGNASPLAKAKRRSISKGSKGSANDGDGSESEDTATSARTEAIKIKKNDTVESNTNEKTAKVDSPAAPKPAPTPGDEPIMTRKRRRSNLEEAIVMTVIESSSPIPEKKNKADKTEEQEPSSSKDDKTHTTKDTAPKKPEPSKPKSKDEEPSSSTQETETLRVTPIKLVALPRTNKQTPKMFAATKSPPNPTITKEDDKTPQKTKPSKPDTRSTSEKPKEEKAKKRNSRSNKSLNESVTKTPKTAEKKTENENNESKANDKESKGKENKKKETDDTNKTDQNKADKSSKDRITFDDDTSLAVIARERRRSNANLPFISSVVSLSTIANASLTTDTPTTSNANIAQTVQASSNSSIFTPTSTVPVTNMKDAVTKLQKLRDNAEPLVGRVGVRAFARMTSPNIETEKSHDSMEVEIKAEPIDMEEDEVRLSEKMDLMTACKLQPVGQTQSLRDVRISRVVTTKKTEPRPRARKTFPQPKANEGRSELNGKNTMVYIPIQPPATQPPARPARPAAQVQRVNALPGGNNTVNTVTTPLKPATTISSPVSMPTAGQVSVPTVGASNQVTVPTVGPVNMPTVSINQSGQMLSTVGQVSVPTVGQVPTTVHTVPLMTSVNGQWMFSLQPIMSVGGVDNTTVPPLVNGSVPSLVPVKAAGGAPAPARPNDATPAELPRLQQRPTLAQTLEASSSSTVSVPATAGPLTAKICQNAQKLTDFFRSLLEESIEDLQDPAASASALRLQLEQARWRHTSQIEELKFNHELTLAEMRLSFEKEKVRVATEARRAVQADLDAAVKVAKSKQWCANCSQEAQLYCCWNTAYCDYPCQRAHWPTHNTACAQIQQDSNADDTSTADVQILPEIPSLQKSNQPPTPALTVGGKLARVFPQDTAQQKTSIIVSMVEDTSGNQTMKCVGTYKPGASPAQMPPLIINKQMVSDDMGKKVVTSGGYLIVGAGNNTSVIAPGQTRRPNTVQYFT